MNNGNDLFPSNTNYPVWDDNKMKAVNNILCQMNAVNQQMTKQVAPKMDLASALYQRMIEQGNIVPRFYPSPGNMQIRHPQFQGSVRHVLIGAHGNQQRLMPTGECSSSCVYYPLPDPHMSIPTRKSPQANDRGYSESPAMSMQPNSNICQQNQNSKVNSPAYGNIPILLSDSSFRQNFRYLNSVVDHNFNISSGSSTHLQHNASSTAAICNSIITNCSHHTTTDNNMTKAQTMLQVRQNRPKKLYELVEDSETSEDGNISSNLSCKTKTSKTFSVSSTPSDTSKSPSESMISGRSEKVPVSSTSLTTTVPISQSMPYSQGDDWSIGHSSMSLSPILYCSEILSDGVNRKSSTPNSNLPLKKRTLWHVDIDVVDNAASKSDSKEVSFNHAENNSTIPIKKLLQTNPSPPIKKESKPRKKAKGNLSQTIRSRLFNSRSIFSNIPKTFLPMERHSHSPDSDSDDDVMIIECKEPNDSFCLHNI